MKLKYAPVAAALAALSLPSTALADTPELYGLLNLTAQANEVAGNSETKVASHGSRFGIRGSHELSANLEAIYQAEFGLRVTDGDPLSHRNQFIGLKGDFGMTTVGRRDTALKRSRGNVEQFLTFDGDLNKTMGGEVRAGQQVSYTSPRIANLLMAEITYVAENGNNGDSGLSSALMLGDARYQLQPFYAAVAYDSKVANRDILRATVGGSIAGFELGAIYSDEEIVDGDEAGASGDAFLVSANYTIGKTKLKVQYSDGDVPGKANTSYTLGGEYRLSTPLRVHAYYTGVEWDSRDNDDRYLAVGLQYNF
ncbi:porin [Ferrimonas marina]|uniref:Outer membrane protein (Porin) n=1 Tax=Ferrimonas marina TaxID=299255 RepID=A0A1M5ZEN9_9GAMM|nr:porin [Ferrimonas marina]SHI22687.1 Outer membrane protein (porin) [Ferrimonas marina]